MARAWVKPLADSLSRFRFSYSPLARGTRQETDTPTTRATPRRALAVDVHTFRSRLDSGYLDVLHGALAALFDFSTRLTEYALPSKLRSTRSSVRSSAFERFRMTPDGRDDRAFANANRIPAHRVSNRRRVQVTLLDRLAQPSQTNPFGAYSGRAIGEPGATATRFYRITPPTGVATGRDREARRVSLHRIIAGGNVGRRGPSTGNGAAISHRATSSMGAFLELRDFSRLASTLSRAYGFAQRGSRAVQLAASSGARDTASGIAAWSSGLHHSNSSGGPGKERKSTSGASLAAARAAQLRTIRRIDASPSMAVSPLLTATAAGSPTGTSQVSPPMVINFSPTVVVHGGTDAGDLERRVVQAIGRHSHELIRILTRELQQRSRTAF